MEKKQHPSYGMIRICRSQIGGPGTALFGSSIMDTQTLSRVKGAVQEKAEMPDQKVSVEEMHAYGYTWEGMLPLTKERALELMDTELQVFKLYADNAEGMAENKNEIISHEVDEEALKKLQAKCAEEVKRINGAVIFEEAYILYRR